jgi:hypothetical protein
MISEHRLKLHASAKKNRAIPRGRHFGETQLAKAGRSLRAGGYQQLPRSLHAMSPQELQVNRGPFALERIHFIRQMHGLGSPERNRRTDRPSHEENRCLRITNSAAQAHGCERPKQSCTSFRGSNPNWFLDLERITSPLTIIPRQII